MPYSKSKELRVYRQIWMHMIVQRKQQFRILSLCLHPLQIFLESKAQIIQRILHFSTLVIATNATNQHHINHSNKYISFLNNKAEFIKRYADYNMVEERRQSTKDVKASV